MPSRDSYLVVGSYEAAQKKLVSASLDIKWGELPRDGGGFRQYYRGYDTQFSNDSFPTEITVLRDSQWQPLRSEETVSIDRGNRTFTMTARTENPK